MEIGETLLVRTSEEWRRWLERCASTAREIWLVNFKKGTGKQALDYQLALDEATCFGWVDTMIKRIDDERYAIRFVPRRPKSSWTSGNLERARRLVNEGRMTPAGLAALPQGEARRGR
ncbi:MAG: hypothetical protein JOY80_08820 [Candidatus Dormibacteraeota bacterium]|nr:hypothetical protein [Candidatus Dormibacteraeota bacterium]